MYVPRFEISQNLPRPPLEHKNWTKARGPFYHASPALGLGLPFSHLSNEKGHVRATNKLVLRRRTRILKTLLFIPPLSPLPQNLPRPVTIPTISQATQEGLPSRYVCS
jgi:hypothetical protein